MVKVKRSEPDGVDSGRNNYLCFTGSERSERSCRGGWRLLPQHTSDVVAALTTCGVSGAKVVLPESVTSSFFTSSFGPVGFSVCRCKRT